MADARPSDPPDRPEADPPAREQRRGVFLKPAEGETPEQFARRLYEALRAAREDDEDPAR
jgi:hypothetical protein